MSARLASPVAIAGGVVLLAIVLLDPRAAAAGWRAGFLFGSAIPVGALVWRLVARVTGGAWSTPLAPFARATPLLFAAALPLIAAQALAAPVPPPHLATYMAWPFFALRTAAALALWTWAARREPEPRGAALALTAHALAVSLLALDWILAVAPGHAATVMGMALAVQQLLGGAAAACLLGDARGRDGTDIAKLLVACAIGLAYLLFMDWLVGWYANLPERVGWYLAREGGGWPAVAAAALLAGAGTIAAAASRRFRLAGALALGGLLLAELWLETPGSGPLAPLAGVAVAALLAGGGLLLVARREAAHG